MNSSSVCIVIDYQSQQSAANVCPQHIYTSLGLSISHVRVFFASSDHCTSLSLSVRIERTLHHMLKSSKMCLTSIHAPTEQVNFQTSVWSCVCSEKPSPHSDALRSVWGLARV